MRLGSDEPPLRQGSEDRLLGLRTEPQSPEFRAGQVPSSSAQKPSALPRLRQPSARAPLRRPSVWPRLVGLAHWPQLGTTSSQPQLRRPSALPGSETIRSGPVRRAAARRQRGWMSTRSPLRHPPPDLHPGEHPPALHSDTHRPTSAQVDIHPCFDQGAAARSVPRWTSIRAPLRHPATRAPTLAHSEERPHDRRQRVDRAQDQGDQGWE